TGSGRPGSGRKGYGPDGCESRRPSHPFAQTGECGLVTRRDRSADLAAGVCLENVMASEVESNAAAEGLRKTAHGRRVRGALILFMGCLAIMAAFFAGSLGLFVVGLLLCVCGVLEMLETFRLLDEDRRVSAYLSGILSVVAGILLLAEPHVVLRGLSLVVAGSFLIDGVNKLATAWRSRTVDRPWRRLLAGGLINVLLGL